MQLTPRWEFVSDRVMGGLSIGQLELTTMDRIQVARLTGTVSLENNGGFVQMAFDIQRDGGVFDASEFAGIEIEIAGNNESYDLRLRTSQLTRPWQSFRSAFVAGPSWRKQRIPFSGFVPHRTEVAFDPSRLRRIGVLAIGRSFAVDVSVRSVAFYR